MNLDSAILYTHDISKVITFYKDIIGLDLEYQQDDMYCSFLFANNVKLGIKKQKEEREVPGSQTIFIAIKDIGFFYEKMKGKVSIHKELIQQKWGFEFSVLDPDGNKVLFIERNV